MTPTERAALFAEYNRGIWQARVVYYQDPFAASRTVAIGQIGGWHCNGHISEATYRATLAEIQKWQAA